jgi:hypothetical protein
MIKRKNLLQIVCLTLITVNISCSLIQGGKTSTPESPADKSPTKQEANLTADSSTPSTIPTETQDLMSLTPTITINPENKSNPNKSDSDIWNRRDVPLEEVQEQISFTEPGGAGGRGSICGRLVSTEQQPAIIFSSDEKQIEINQLGEVCITGFAEAEKVNVEIIGPDDRKYQKIFKASRLFTNVPSIGLGLLPKPGNAYGMYKISAISDDVHLQETFEVIRSETPRILLSSDTEPFSILEDYAMFLDHITYGPFDIVTLNPYDTMSIFAAGFSPNRDLLFQLYRGSFMSTDEDLELDCMGRPCKVYNLEYATSWTNKTNHLGEFVLDLKASGEDSEGLYLLFVSGPNAPSCGYVGPFFTSTGDWSNLTCDALFRIQIGDSNLPKLEP